MRTRQLLISIVVLLTIFLSMPGISVLTHAATYPGQPGAHRNNVGAPHSVLSRSAQFNAPANTSSWPTPFMHRPYYGSRTILQRTVSFVDHDKPWYVNDGLFVRYDGARWTNVGIGSCIAGVNCYDGHNGYDLNLRFEPVLSVAAGTVIRAGWYNPLNHESALGLWAAVDQGNGFVTAYGHLSALTVAVGDHIGTQWQLGTSGTTGSSTGPHLHLATYYLPYWNATDPFGWTGNYPDPNVVPDHYLWVDDPGTSSTIPNLSANGSAVYPGSTLVDDGGTGWSSTGNWYRTTSSTDIGGSLHWAVTSPGAATATATWRPGLSADGYYEVGVFVDDNHASSGWAPYTIYSADPQHPGVQLQHTVYVDEEHIGSFQGPYGWENTGPQWIGLGTYYFRATQAGRVILSNATGESGLQLAADGVEFAPISVQSPLYHFDVTNDTTPIAMLPGGTTNVSITIKNTSNFTWKAAGNDAVQLIYRWLGTDHLNHPVIYSALVGLPHDVSIGASVTLTVPVHTPAQAASYILQWDMLQGTTVFSQQGAQVHDDSVRVAGYAEVFDPVSLPTTLSLGASIKLTVQVQNIGAMTWPASGSAQVTLGYRWLDSSGHPIDPSIAGPGSIGTLPADVPMGGKTSIPIVLHTPVLAGNYQLVYDLQQQGTTFSSQGATPLTLSETIVPILPKLYYFAEGYTGIGTTEYLSLTNPSASPTTISITYLYQQSPPQTRTYQVPAQSQFVLNINAQVGENQAISMIVQGDQPFVAERTMFMHKGAFVAASDSLGSPVLSTTWYFAEGNTTFGWHTLLAVLNPSAQPVTNNISYLCGGLCTIYRTAYIIPARSRGTIILNSAVPNSRFGMIIHASAPVLIERPEYLVESTLRGGSAVVGATAPQTTWYFAAGNTTSGFNERLILANPSPVATTVQIQYLTTDGQVITQKVVVPGQSRIEVNVNSVLRPVIHATVITAGSPIVAERQDFFNTTLNSCSGPSSCPLLGSTTTMGSSNISTGWYLAHGDTSSGHAQSLLLANPNAVAVQVQVVYYLASGAPIVKTYTLAAHSRLTVSMLGDVGANTAFGVAVYAAMPIVVEQTMFFNVQGASGGYASMAYGV